MTSNKSIDTNRVAKVHSVLKVLVEELYGTDCYLAVLFKNTKKCEVLQEKVMAKLRGVK